MNDQAAALRGMRFDERGTGVVAEGPPTVVVASGKGGVGRSVVATVVAAGLADLGRRVLLVDGDQNLGNLHVLLGVRPAERLEALVRLEASPADLLTPVSANLWLLPADSGAEGLYSLGAVDRARLHYRLNGLFDRFETVVIDASGDLESVVRVASMGATALVVVTVPEPAALIGAYAMMKIVHVRVPSLPMDVLVNRVRKAPDGPKAFRRLEVAAERFLGRKPRHLGDVPEDRAVARAVREPGRLLKNLQDSSAVRQLREIATTYLDLVAVSGATGSVVL